MKVSVYLFTYGGIVPETMFALMAEKEMWPFQFQQCWNAAALDRNRSLMASRFLDTDSDVFVSIDHDTQWTPGAVAKLAIEAYNKKAVVGGVYSKRNFGKGLAVRFLNSREYVIPSDEVVTAQWVAGGFLAAHREVLEKIRPTLPDCRGQKTFWPFFLPLVHEGEYLTEDWSFCQRAREAGYEIYADLSIALTHVGSWGFRPIDAITKLPENGGVTVKVT